MRIGVVTPVLDGRGTFRGCAASVRAAARAPRAPDVLHYVRESDRSRDGGVREWAEAYGCRYHCGPDAGLYDAIAAGLDEAAADGCDALAWLNADEQWLPDAPAHAQRVFESAPRVGIVYGDYLLLGRDGVPCAARREIPVRRAYLRFGVNYLLSCTVFFRASVWRESPKFDLTYRLLADKKWYFGCLSRGVRASLVADYLGAYAMTGGNASLSRGAVAEQERLRAEIGGDVSAAARALVRAARVAEKAVHGCYIPERVEAPLFAPDGSFAPFRGRLGPFWRWR